MILVQIHLQGNLKDNKLEKHCILEFNFQEGDFIKFYINKCGKKNFC